MKAIKKKVISDLALQYISTAKQETEALGLFVEFRSDLEYWVRMMEEGDGTKHRNLAFDPAVSDVRQAGFLHVLEHDGTTVGVCAIKRWVTEDFLEDFASQALWMGTSTGKIPRMVMQPETAALPLISGVCTYAGGLWIRPDRRGGRLSALMSPLTRAWGIHQWQPDWMCGATTSNIAKAGFPLDQYQYEHAVIATRDQYFAVSDRQMSLALPYEHIDEWFARTRMLVETGVAVRSDMGQQVWPVRTQPDVTRQILE